MPPEPLRPALEKKQHNNNDYNNSSSNEDEQKAFQYTRGSHSME